MIFTANLITAKFKMAC